VRQIFLDGPDGTAALVIGLPGLPAGHADRRVLDALAAVLGDPAGRLRTATAAAGMRSVRIAVVDGPDAGYLALELEGRPPADAAVAAAETVIRSLATEPFTAAELAIARAAMAPSHDVVAHADALAHSELHGGAPAPSIELDSTATLQRVAGEILRWDDAVIATVRPPDITPGARARAIKRLPPRRTTAPRRGTHRRAHR
jgi:hypothetical protein